jgi:23S rRNA pseudouridine1911/1915/1917 synthase
MQDEHHGKSIGMFLKEKGFSRAVMIELKKEKMGITKNGVHAGVNEVVATGDLLELCLIENVISENIVPTKGVLDILYEDEDILAVNKPYHTPIHPSVNNYENTLANRVMYYAKQQGTPYPFRCINRLDRDTTGVTILAKNLLSASILAKRVKEQQLKKTYIAFVEGVTKEEGIIDVPIGRMEGSIIKRQVDEKEGKQAVTHYQRRQVLEVEGKAVSVVSLQLKTGRTHQIRVHMASIGHPLLGDFLYNENNHMLTRQALHVLECVFNHPISGECIKITAPLPKDMTGLICVE